jgi:predicted membrane protein
MRAADKEEAYMPVLLLWAVPAVIVVGGVGYYFVRVVH